MPTTRSIADLRRELAAKESQMAKLRAQRDKVAKQLAGLDRQIAALGGEAAPARKPARKRAPKDRTRAARSTRSLGDVLAEVLGNKGNVKVAQAAKLALEAGYKSKSAQFGNIVSQTLSVDKRFKKISRGVYVLKGGEKAAVRKVGKKVAERTAKAGKRTKTQQSLGDLLAEVAKGRKLLSVADAVRLGLEKGYKSQAKNFQLAVNQALMKDKRFGRVARGIYTLKRQEGGIPDEMLERPVKRKAKKKVARKKPKRIAARGS